MSRYRTIVADPPWDYKTPGQIGKTLEHRPNRDLGLSRHGAGSIARYGSMSTEELRALPVAQFADDNAHLYRPLRRAGGTAGIACAKLRPRT